jgi:hypothetical protein
MKKQKIRKKPVYEELRHHPADRSPTEKGKLYFSEKELMRFSDGFKQALDLFDYINPQMISYRLRYQLRLSILQA